MIVTFAATGFAPAGHMMFSQGLIEGLQGFAVEYTGVKILLDLLALFFYLTHIPERWWPHTFDLWVRGLFYFPIVLWAKNGKLIRIC